MCGICGQINFNGAPGDKALIKAMTGTLKHRGPDDEGYYFDRNVGLGHRRLSIIDLATGHQPMSNEDGTIWIVSDSEIYNYIELRKELKSRGHIFSTKSDTEVIIHLYEELQERCVEKLIGMFAFSIWDRKRKKLFLARDRFGIKPLHYFYNKNILIFASEIKALLKYKHIDKTLNPAAIDQYFTFLYIVDPNTIFKQIHKLPPAHYLVCENKRLYIKKYWDIKFIRDSKHGERYYSDNLKLRLNESIKSTLRSDVPVGVFLSGGIDSSAVAGLATKFNKKINTFSVIFKEKLYSEEQYSRLASKAFNTEHYELTVGKKEAYKAIPKIASFLDEPFGDSSCIPTYYISKLARGSVKTVLTGEGGDELFAGYPWHRNRIYGGHRLKTLMAAPGKVIFNDKLRHLLYSHDVRKEVNPDYFNNVNIDFKRLNRLNTLNKLLHIDLNIYLPSDMLVKLDRMSMLNSLEARVPMLNHNYVEFVASIPSVLKFKSGIKKYLFKKTFTHIVPKKIIDRTKMGFSVPLDIWLWQKGKFRDLIYDVIFDSRTKRRKYFNYKIIEKMFYEQERLLQLHGHQIWTLFMFEMWQRNYLDI